MTLPKPNRSPLVVSVAVVMTLAIAGSLVWGFAQQLTLARQMRAEEMRLEQAVAAERARHEELTARLEYVRSDEYVERWAREEAKMARPGEVVVIPLASANSEEADAPREEVSAESRPFWIELWELVFGPVAAEQP